MVVLFGGAARFATHARTPTLGQRQAGRQALDGDENAGGAARACTMDWRRSSREEDGDG